MGPQTGFTGSAFSMQTNLVGGRLAQNGPQDQENPLLGVFGLFRGPGGRKISLGPPDPSKNQQTANFSGETNQRRRSKKVAQRERGSDELKNPRKLASGAELGPKRFVVGWVPNRQNRSPTDETAPSLPPKRPYLGTQGHVGPQTGFTGSAFSMRSNLIGRRFPQNGPQDRENPLLGFFDRFWAPNGPKFSLSPPDPQKPVNHEFLEKLG